MTGGKTSRWARRYVAVAVCWLILWQVGLLAGIPNRTEVVLGLYGFVLSIVFGKAYSLVPTYFDRTLADPRATVVGLPLLGSGVACLAAEPFAGVPRIVGLVGAISWTGGVAVFVGTLAWKARDNLTGRETGTGGVNAHRASVDRIANAFVPVVLAYLLLGSYETVAAYGLVQPLFDAYPPRTTHLLGAGVAALLVFALGYRLLPRFLVADVPKPLVVVVLSAGALGPILLAVSLPAGTFLLVGGMLETVAVVGYAIGFALLFCRSNRRRVAFYGIAAGAAGGVVAVFVGLWIATSGLSSELIATHRRLMLLGFLGLTIVGVSFQFYPPNVGRWPGCADRTALVVIGLFAAGVALQAGGLATATTPLELIGVLLGISGALGYGYLLSGAFATR